MSENELYGLMAIAREHQATAEKAGQKVEAAAQVLLQAAAAYDRARGELTATAGEAIRAAVAGHAASMVQPLRDGAALAREAAAEIRLAGRGILWAWLGCALAVGGVLGGGAMWWGQVQQSERIARIEGYAQHIYAQTPEAKSFDAKTPDNKRK